MPDSDDMRYEAAKWAIILACMAAIMTTLFLFSGLFKNFSIFSNWSDCC